MCLRPFEANIICLKYENFSKSDGPTQAEFYAQQFGVIFEKNRSMWDVALPKRKPAAADDLSPQKRLFHAKVSQQIIHFSHS